MERIDKILSHIGVATRTECKKLVRDGAVTVNGVRVRSSSEKADPERDEITVYGEKIRWREFVYFMMNKPDGVVSATEDNKYQTVVDLLSPEDAHFMPYPVGRLDRDTVGLVILTNNGELAHRIISPKNHIPKTYIAKISGEVTDYHVSEFEKGVTLDDGYVTMPGKLEILDDFVRITIHEGKFHQIKRMFEAYGLSVTYLKRISIGGILLDETLPEGEYRELTSEEIKILKKGC